MAYIFRVPNLQSLTLDIFLEDWVNPAVGAEGGFPSLQKLALVFSPVVETIEFIGWLSRASPTTLSVHFSDPPDTSEIHSFFSAITTGISHSSLSEINLSPEAGLTNLAQSEDHCLESRSLRLLVCFSSITSVRIHLHGASDVDDHTVADLSRAWPRPEKLRLSLPERSVTLACLPLFATHCPHLTKLEMSFDTTRIPLSTHMLEHRLESLVVNESPLENPQIVPVARFRSAIFPGLQRLYQNDWKFVWIAEGETPEQVETRGWGNCWKEAEDLVRRAGVNPECRELFFLIDS